MELQKNCAPQSEPIAIVGLGCRFPGAPDAPSYWRLLCDGVDAITEVPPDRWDVDEYYDPRPATPGKMNTRCGGFIEHPELFDPYFFGISPREASRLDPQQRLLLETAWDAIEDAGIPLTRLKRSNTGVFIGVCSLDYTALQQRRPRCLDAYVGSGSARAVAGRLAHTFGLNGPVMAIDTACSSSMVSTHLAVQAIERGECEMAFAGGVSAVLSPMTAIAFCQAGMLSPDGRCMTFDSRANGFVRSEGGGVVVLKRLSRALEDNDRIYALIRGTAINNDGDYSPFMAPSVEGQEAVLRCAYARAGISPLDVQYVEAHGTGTRIGDRIEMTSLNRVLGEGRSRERSCWVGSCKTNIGHTEAAAGIAGLIKTTYCLWHRTIPPNLHFVNPTPRIDWDNVPFVVPTKLEPWPQGDGPAIAGANSFGISGTNAHVVMTEAPRTEGRDAVGGPAASVLTISAQTQASLAANAGAFRDFLAKQPEDTLRDICYTSACRRTHHAERLAIAGESAEQLQAGLRAYLAGEGAAGLHVGSHHGADPKQPILVFSGVGSQWVGMGRRLRDEEPVFRDTLIAADAAIRPVAGWSVLEEIDAPPESSRLNRIDIMQPAIFSVQVALGALWKHWGIEPAAVVGHSLGEAAAAHFAGALTLEDAALAVCVRSRLMHRTSGQGRMLALEGDWERAQRTAAASGGKISAAVWNSPTSVVLSGDPEALAAAKEELDREETFCRWVRVDVACHSVQMEPLQEELRGALRGIRPRPASLPIYSTVTGETIEGEALDGEHWERNLRAPVLFSPVIDGLIAAGHDVFLEVSPHPLLAMPMAQTAAGRSRKIATLASLKRNEDGRVRLMDPVAALHVNGVSLDWEQVVTPGGRVVSLPGYQWQRERYWFDDNAPVKPAVRSRHPFLQNHWESAEHPGTHVWEVELDLDAFPYLADHCFQNVPLMPGAVYVEMALAASWEIHGPGPRSLLDMEFLGSLFLRPESGLRIQLVLTPVRDGVASFRVFGAESNSEVESNWIRCAKGVIQYDDIDQPPSAPVDMSDESLENRYPDRMDAEAFYAVATRKGLDYGPAFRSTRRGWYRTGETAGVTEVEAPDFIQAEAKSYRLHPAFLDNVNHSVYAVADQLPGRKTRVSLPVRFEGLHVYRIPDAGDRLRCHVRVERIDDHFRRHQVHVVDSQGRTVIRESQVSRIVDDPVKAKLGGGLGDVLYRIRWDAIDRPQISESTPARWLILADRGGVGDQLKRALESRGHRCTLADSRHVDPGRPDATREFVRSLVSDGDGWDGIVHLWSLDAAAGEDLTSDSLADFQHFGCGPALYLTQALAEETAKPTPRLWLVTRGAQCVGPDGGTVSLSQAPLLGFGRTIANEFPRLHSVLVDIDGTDAGQDAECLLAELLAPDQEREVAWRDGQRFGPRLVRFKPGDSAPKPRRIRIDESSLRSYQLETKGGGVLDNLVLRETTRRSPGPDEVEIRVRAVGLNFLDVLKALDMLPPAAVGSSQFGMECAGVVVAVGRNVGNCKPGDEVFVRDPALNGCFRPFLTTRAASVFPKPPALSMEEAVTIPVAYQTAYYALHKLGRLREGESVLIHSAAGGVGLAAVEIARQTGAEVFATAGTDEKREYLRSLGVRHVMDSRNLDFADEILRATDGRGVDVALNSLAGEAIPKTLSVLATGGRFLEIGKRDIYGDSQLGLLPFQKNLSFFAVDLLRLSLERPDVVDEVSREVASRIADGSFKPLPFTCFPVDRVADAFHYMAPGKHIGKIVVTLAAEEIDVEPPPFSIRGDATYLITGGTGGLGLQCAEWLVDKGARHIALLSRRGRSAESEATLAALASDGARIEVIAADVSRADQLAAAIERIRASMPPLRGVIHAAGIVRDATIEKLDWQAMEAVFAPKIQGAWNLDRLLDGTQLDFFTLFSSLSSTVGNPGQGNYAAANAFLDALAARRAGLGLPGQAINWGPWSEVGMAANEKLEELLSAGGSKSFSPEQGIQILESVLPGEAHQVVAAAIDWKVWAKHARHTGKDPRYKELVEAASGEGAVEETSLDRQILTASTPEEGRRILEDRLQQEISAVLRIPIEKLDRDAGLGRLGLDSLMAVELRNRIEALLPVDIPVVRLLSGPTLVQLAEDLYRKLEAAVSRADKISEVVARVAEMSDSDVEALLQRTDSAAQ